jgi:hypothetical protein
MVTRFGRPHIIHGDTHSPFGLQCRLERETVPGGDCAPRGSRHRHSWPSTHLGGS